MRKPGLIRTTEKLLTILENGKTYEAEELAERTGAELPTVHRAFAQLQRRPGWSIVPKNRTAYEREDKRYNVRRPAVESESVALIDMDPVPGRKPV